MKIKELRVKLAIETDTATVTALLKKVAGWLREREIKQWGFLLSGGEDEEIKQDIMCGNTYIISYNNETIGTFTLLNIQSEWDVHIWGNDNTNSIYLHRLAVCPSFMRTGIGKWILSWIETNVASEKEYIKFDCVADNEQLNRFYTANGFIKAGTTTDGHNKYYKSLKLLLNKGR